MEIKTVAIDIPEGANIIVGQTHFIKSIEDLYEAVVNTSPHIKFGIAFNEASGVCLTRKDGNDEKLTRLAVDTARRIGAGHIFVIFLENGFPINVLPSIKAVREVVHIFCATANPLEVIVGETQQGRGVLGVIDGSMPKGVESEGETEERKTLLRKFGYKR
ncbi:MAG: adenosine-specific kinase [Spirochaetes bacterium]|nr:adenosine-specific kinase [Spirochaetota bacterium]